MRRRELILAGTTLLIPAQVLGQAGQQRSLAIVNAVAEEEPQLSHVAAFKQRIAQLGWTEGKNLRIDVHWSGGSADAIGRTARAISKNPPDVVLTSGTEATAAVYRENPGIRVVFVNVGDPFGSGFVSNAAKPSGLLTGFTSSATTITLRRRLPVLPTRSRNQTTCAAPGW
jgi:putative ABC transport system substrate-binding protein